jgi:hypothetical protein
MWHQVGFLADAFAVFKRHGLSVDLVSTSETSVTVSLDPAANTLDARAIELLVADLSTLCRVEVIGPCAAVSLVGRNIRATLHRLGDALELFEEQRIYLVTQAAERPESHVRGRRGTGRSSRAAAARADGAERAIRPRARTHLGADPWSRSGGLVARDRRGGRRAARS